MPDVHSPAVRHYNMSCIHGKDTKPEELVRKFLFANGFRYRKNDPRLPGKPDIVLPKYKTVVFVNGCFWHKHNGCKYFVWPQNNADFWREKINTNVQRDQANYQKLQESGWRVLTVWECELKKEKRLACLEQLCGNIRQTLDCVRQCQKSPEEKRAE